jgi:zinc transport system permease protein
MLGAVILSMVFTSGGLFLSYAPDLPSGAVTILLAGITYVLTLLITSFRTQK